MAALRAVFAAIGAGALALATTGGAWSQTPKRGGTLTLAIEGETPNLDCQQQSSIYILAMARPYYSGLIRFDQNNYPNIVGDLAESWTISSDGLAYTFKMRDGAKFHDGTPFTSADVKATFDRARTPPAGVVSVRASDFADVASIETPDAATAIFRLKQPSAAFLDLLASPFNCIYSARKLAENPKYPETAPLGTGGFSFGEYTKGSLITGKRFDGYFRPGLPYLDEVRNVVVSANTPVNALVAGQIDAFIVRALTPPEEERVRKELGDKVAVESTSVSFSSGYGINMKRKPFDDVRVRRALTLAIDRWGALPSMQKIQNVSSVGGLLRPGYDLALPKAELEKIPGYWPDIEASRAEARRLLAEAGAPNLKFSILSRNSGAGVQLGIFMVDQWRRIGLDVQRDALEVAMVVSRQQAGDYDVLSDGGGAATDDPTAVVARFLPGNSANSAGLPDQTMVDLFNKQKVTLDRNERRRIVNDLERRGLEQVYYITNFWSSYTPAYRSYVKGWKVVPSQYVGHDLVDIWKDQ